MKGPNAGRAVLVIVLSLFSPLSGSVAPDRDDPPDEAKVPFRLVTQDNLWFSGAPSYGNYKLYGKWMIPIFPLLGCTNSWDVRVKKQELQWLLRYSAHDGSGLVVSQEWIQPGDGICSFIRTVFLPILEKHGNKALWNVFYDPVLAALQRKLITVPPIDFRLPAVRKMWEDDLKFIRREYFGQRQYWKIGGKPVLYIWNVPALIGADAAFAAARRQGVYLLGDVLNSQVSNPAYLDGLPPLDGATGFTVVIDVLAGAETTIGEWLPYFAGLYKSWNEETGKRGLGFMPAGSCQYDDTEFGLLIDKKPTRILARNRGEVEGYLSAAGAAAKPVGGTRYVVWGTSNNWAEGTTLQPTRLVADDKRFYVLKKLAGKPVRRIGPYGFEHLEAVKKVLFPAEKSYTRPVVTAAAPVLAEDNVIKRKYRVKVRFSDCDFMGTLTLTSSAALTVENPPELATLKNLTELQGFILEWTAQVMVDVEKAAGKSQWLKISFANRDLRAGRRTIVIE